MKRQPWSAIELEALRQQFPCMKTADLAAQFKRSYGSVAQKAADLGITKSAEFQSSEASGRLRKGKALKGQDTRFKAGHETWNKGMKGIHLSPETQFRKGNRPHTWRPVGTLRMFDGYLQRKVTDTGYPPRDWQGVHRLVWEAAHGPVPAGHIVVFKRGRFSTEESEIVLDALEMITRIELMKRNSVHQYGPEIAQLAQLRGAITRQINKRSRQHGE